MCVRNKKQEIKKIMLNEEEEQRTKKTTPPLSQQQQQQSSPSKAYSAEPTENPKDSSRSSSNEEADSKSCGETNVLSLKRVTDGVAIAHSESLCPRDSFTIEFWMNPDPGKCTTSIIVSKTDDTWGSGYGVLCGKDGSVRFYHSDLLDDPSVEIARDAVQPGRWAHICCVYTGRALEIYVNGALGARTGFAHRRKVSYGDGGEKYYPLCIGHRRWGKANYGYTGLIAELRIWSVAKRAHEVSQLMQGLPLSSAWRRGLALHMRFAGLHRDAAAAAAAAEPTVQDSSGQENHGVLVGGATLERLQRLPVLPFAPSFSLRALCLVELSRMAAENTAAAAAAAAATAAAPFSVEHYHSTGEGKDFIGGAKCEGVPRRNVLVVSVPSLRFRLTGPAPIGVPLTESFVLTNPTSSRVSAQLPKEVSTHAYNLQFEPSFVNIRGGSSVTIKATLLVSCTTSLHADVAVAIFSNAQRTPSPLLTSAAAAALTTNVLGGTSGTSRSPSVSPANVAVGGNSNSTGSINLSLNVNANIIINNNNNNNNSNSSGPESPGKVGSDSSVTSPSSPIPTVTPAVGRFKRKHDRAPDAVQTLRVDVDSELSSRLDYAEIQLEQEPIGEGSFGVVYKGTWRGTPVAVKRLRSQYLTKLELDEFRGEVELMERLRSQYIANFIGAIFTRGHLALVTEFVPLGSVKSLIKAQNRKIHSPRIKFRIVHDTACALNFLHQNSILHRDVKTGNILVCSLSSRAAINAKLIDFGTSRPIATTTVTAASALAPEAADEIPSGIGTPVFMAPEVLENKPYTKNADVYSFAVMMYELWTEKSPYSSNTKFPTIWGKSFKYKQMLFVTHNIWLIHFFVLLCFAYRC